MNDVCKSSRTSPIEPNEAPGFYDWSIVAACFGLTLTLGEAFWSFGVFFVPLQQEFGWNRAVVSSFFTAFLLGYAVSVVVSGRIADRYNPKPVLFVSAFLVGIGLCLCGFANNVHHLRLFIFVVGLGSGATWSIPNSIVQRWFHRKKQAGLALGIVVSGVGVGALIFAPLNNYLILNWGWRSTFLAIGVLFSGVIVASTLAIKRCPPNTLRSAPKGDCGSLFERAVPHLNKSQITSWTFAATVFMLSAGVFSFQIVSTHMVAHASDLGISPSAAAAALGFMGALSIPGRMVSGILSTKLGWNKLLSFAYFGIGVSIVWLWLLSGDWMLHCFALSYGVFHGVRIAGGIGVLGEIFGLQSLGELIGVSTAVAQIVGAFAPYAAGAIFDATGSYSLVFFLVCISSAAAGVVAALLKRIGASYGASTT